MLSLTVPPKVKEVEFCDPQLKKTSREPRGQPKASEQGERGKAYTFGPMGIPILIIAERASRVFPSTRTPVKARPKGETSTRLMPPIRLRLIARIVLPLTTEPGLPNMMMAPSVASTSLQGDESQLETPSRTPRVVSSRVARHD